MADSFSIYKSNQARNAPAAAKREGGGVDLPGTGSTRRTLALER